METRALAALWFCVCAAAQETAAVHGVVINTQTGQPLPAAQVHFLVRIPDSGLVSQYGALADEHGRFSVDALRPGTYFVSARRSGYVAGLNSITVSAGQHLEDLRVEATPRAIISGRVTDEAGDPMAKLTIRAESASGDDMVLAFNGIGGGATDDRGQYRISVPPGKYRIKAQVQNFPSDEPEEIRTDGTIPAVHPDTWYPNAAAQSGGVAVETKAGRETNGIDIRMAQPVRLSLSGTVTGTPGDTTALVNVNAHVRQGNTLYDVAASAGGSFVIPHLEPGTYQLYAFTAGEPKMRSAVYEFTLTDSAVAGIELSLRARFEVTGTLQMAGGAGSPANRVIRLEMMTTTMGDVRIGAVNSEGAFQVAGVDPERYRVVIRPLPENGYVKAVWLDGTAAPRGVLDLRKGGAGSKLKIAVAADSAQVSGKVEGARGFGSVILMAEGDEDAVNSLSTQTASDGTYSLKPVPPGKYRLIALDASRGYDKADLKRITAKAKLLDIQPNARLTINLELADGKK